MAPSLGREYGLGRGESNKEYGAQPRRACARPPTASHATAPTSLTTRVRASVDLDEVPRPHSELAECELNDIRYTGGLDNPSAVNGLAVALAARPSGVEGATAAAQCGRRGTGRGVRGAGLQWYPLRSCGEGRARQLDDGRSVGAARVAALESFEGHIGMKCHIGVNVG